MGDIRFNGVVNDEYAIIKTLQVANTALVTKGDILVLDAVGGATGSGYVTPWGTATDAVFAVAKGGCAAPTLDGDAEIQAAIVGDNLLLRVDASGIAQGHVGQFCDIDGAQSIDVTSNDYNQALIIQVEVALSKAIIMLHMTPTISNYVDQSTS